MQGPSRKEIWKMFDTISPTYDQVNRIITMGGDVRWRKKMASFLPAGENLKVLDCATGTGDQLFTLLEECDRVAHATGIDLAKEMLKIAEKKLEKKPYISRVKFEHASATALPYQSNSFDALTISFGIRNVDDLNGTLSEFLRVLKPGGRLLILETSVPQNPLLKKTHLFYLRHILPRLGGWVSKYKEAYVYLNKTTETFPCGEAFCTLLKEAGFHDVNAHPLMLGTISLYRADKPA
jgi:demethylmenaquinone methyltransferase/2-methoxy-6-polyprenyl-1,4-benzoquinol methylase